MNAIKFYANDGTSSEVYRNSAATLSSNNVATNGYAWVGTRMMDISGMISIIGI